MLTIKLEIEVGQPSQQNSRRTSIQLRLSCNERAFGFLDSFQNIFVYAVPRQPFIRRGCLFPGAIYAVFAFRHLLQVKLVVEVIRIRTVEIKK